jgi:iron complex transport system substrate-binding protein
MTRRYFLFIGVMAILLCAVGSVPVAAGAVVDEAGRTVTVPPCPRRIVSLAPNITETLFALGLDDRIVGVSTFSDYPEAARKKSKVGSYINLSLEKIVSLNPDLVIGTADGNKKETVLQLERLGFPVYVINPLTFDDIFETIMHIGQVAGRAAAAKKLVAALKERVNTIVSATKGRERPRVFFQIGVDPMVTVGKNTIHNRLIDLAGGVNVTGDIATPYPRLSMEQVVFARPDIIIVTSMKRDADFEIVRNRWKKWRHIPAVKNGRIHIIDSDLTDHSSPRIVDGLEELVRVIHPEQAETNQKGR